MNQKYEMSKSNLKAAAKETLRCRLGFSPKASSIVILESSLVNGHFNLKFAISGFEFATIGYINEYTLDGYIEYRKFDGVDCEILPLDRLTLTIHNYKGKNVELNF